MRTVALIALLLLACVARAQIPDVYMGYTRGVLLVGKFRSQRELNAMSKEDQRNTLITELAGRTRDSVQFYQGMNDETLAGAGALLAYLRHTGSRNDAQIKTMSADDMRNTVIVEVGVQTGRGSDLQALSNLELIRLVLGPERNYIRGVLLTGRFRTQRELNSMPGEDQRNTLITELTNRTRDDVRFYQGLNDAELAGAGALLVYLRDTGSRNDAQIKSMSADDMRNTVIVEMNAQTRRSDLQTLTNIQLARTALGTRELRAPETLPESERPGQHTVDLRVGPYQGGSDTHGYSDVPVIGPFIGQGLNCEHSLGVFRVRDNGVGQAVNAIVGWGQIEGNGHPGGSTDPCATWLAWLNFDFDFTPLQAIAGITIDRALIHYREEDSGYCFGLLYTQGGVAMDLLPCWTNGAGELEAKANGCLALKVPLQDWLSDRPSPWQEGELAKLGPSSWDVTSIVRRRRAPGLGVPDTGHGFLLIGDALSLGNLTAEDNTRCTSKISDIRLAVTYTVPPIRETFDANVR